MMIKKYILFAVFGLSLLLPLFAEGQSQSGKAASGGGDLGGALAAMDSALTAEREFTSMDEYYLGRAAAANILTVYKPYTRNAELTRYLNLICQTIAVNSPQPEIFNGYHVIILDSSEFNAFATPGGHILITKGLVEAAASEDMLAAVIAHEFAHILLKHGMGVITAMRLNNELTSTADRASGIAARESPDAARAALFRSEVMGLVDTMMKSGYSRSQEFEADTVAITPRIV